MAVGLARTLRVGELVELIDVGLGNHDVDGREHVWAPRGIVFDGVSLFDEAGVWGYRTLRVAGRVTFWLSGAGKSVF